MTIKQAGPKRFKMQKRGNDAEILIYDLIGEDYWGGVSSKTFYEDLNGLGAVNELTIRINSEGGDLREGYAMYHHIRTAGAQTRLVIVDSLAASAASLIAMAGDQIQMAKNAWFMVHNPMTIGVGDYRDFEAYAMLLRAVRDQAAETYAERTGVDVNVVTELMDAETWMDAEKSIKNGFADQQVEMQPMAANLDITRWPNAPQALRMRANNNIVPARIARMARRIEQFKPTFAQG